MKYLVILLILAGCTAKKETVDEKLYSAIKKQVENNLKAKGEGSSFEGLIINSIDSIYEHGQFEYFKVNTRLCILQKGGRVCIDTFFIKVDKNFNVKI